MLLRQRQPILCSFVRWMAAQLRSEFAEMDACPSRSTGEKRIQIICTMQMCFAFSDVTSKDLPSVLFYPDPNSWDKSRSKLKISFWYFSCMESKFDSHHLYFPQRWRWQLWEQGDLLGDGVAARHHLLRPRGSRHRRPPLGTLCSAWARGRWDTKMDGFDDPDLSSISWSKREDINRMGLG